MKLKATVIIIKIIIGFVFMGCLAYQQTIAMILATFFAVGFTVVFIWILIYDFLKDNKQDEIESYAKVENGFVMDNMWFGPYMDDGWQSLINTNDGIISVRFGGKRLMTDKKRPYEVCYPDQDSPVGYQTVDDIRYYMIQKANAK